MNFKHFNYNTHANFSLLSKIEVYNDEVNITSFHKELLSLVLPYEYKYFVLKKLKGQSYLILFDNRQDAIFVGNNFKTYKSKWLKKYPNLKRTDQAVTLPFWDMFFVTNIVSSLRISNASDKGDEYSLYKRLHAILVREFGSFEIDLNGKWTYSIIFSSLVATKFDAFFVRGRRYKAEGVKLQSEPFDMLIMPYKKEGDGIMIADNSGKFLFNSKPSNMDYVIDMNELVYARLFNIYNDFLNN